MLTHFWPGNDRELALQRASRYFAEQILTAEEGLEVQLRSRLRGHGPRR